MTRHAQQQSRDIRTGQSNRTGLIKCEKAERAHPLGGTLVLVPAGTHPWAGMTGCSCLILVTARLEHFPGSCLCCCPLGGLRWRRWQACSGRRALGRRLLLLLLLLLWWRRRWRAGARLASVFAWVASQVGCEGGGLWRPIAPDAKLQLLAGRAGGLEPKHIMRLQAGAKQAHVKRSGRSSWMTP